MNNEFKIRLTRQREEMETLYDELYHMNNELFDSLIKILEDHYKLRTNKQKSYDRARMQVYDWYNGNEMLGIQNKGEIPNIEDLKKHHIHIVSFDKEEDLYKENHEGIAFMANIDVHVEDEYKDDIKRYYVYHYNQIKANTLYTFKEVDHHYIMYDHGYVLNYRNPFVFNELVSKVLGLCNKGIDIINLKNIDLIFPKLNKINRNIDEIHDIVRLLRMIVDIVCPGTLIVVDTSLNSDELYTFFNDGNSECHLVMNHSLMDTLWHTIATRNTSLLRKEIDKISSLSKSYNSINSFDTSINWLLDFHELRLESMSHDSHLEYLNNYFSGQTWDSNASAEVNDNTIQGSIYDLSGYHNALLLKNKYKQELSMNMLKMLYGFLFFNKGIPFINTDDKELYKEIRLLYKIRSENDIFENNSNLWTFDTGRIEVLGVGRELNGKKWLGYFNFSEREIEVTLNGNYTSVLNHLPYGRRFPMKPFEYIWLKEAQDENI